MWRKNAFRSPPEMLAWAGLLLLGGCSVSDATVKMVEAGIHDLELEARGQDVSAPPASTDTRRVDSNLATDAVDASLNADRGDAVSDLVPVDASLTGADLGGARCGNGVCEPGEREGDCCSDCGCQTGSVCSRNICITPTQIVAGGNHACLLLQDGTVVCWGSNRFGELGSGAASLSESAALTPVSGLTNATAISAGATFNCAVLADQTVKCWGDNSVGQLGNGTKSASTLPVPVSNLMGVTAIATGYDFACAVVTGGSAKCWGNNSAGQLGDGTTSQSSVPVSVKDLSGVSGLALGFNATCAVLTDGTVRCWGDNSSSQLGNGTGTNSTTPVRVLNMDSARRIAAMDGAVPGFASSDDPTSFCAVLADGSAKCWGSNATGILGTGAAGNSQSRPVAVKGLEGAQVLSGGEHFACAVTSLGAIDCWGSAQFGVLGNGIDDGMAVLFTSVSGIGNAVAVAAGTWHACALLADASVRCWGSNTFGQLGTETVRSSSVPVTVLGNSGATAPPRVDSGLAIDRETGSAYDATTAYDR